MKTINDQHLKEKIKQNNDYQIKTTSQQILNKFNSLNNTISERKKEKKSFYKPVLAFVSCFAIIILLIVGLNKNPSNSSQLVIENPSKNQILTQELITFTSFNTNNDSPANLYKKSTKNTNQNDFIKIVEKYENVQNGIYYAFQIEDIEVEDLTFNDYYLNDTYKYVSNFYFNKEKIASLYYNQLKSEVDDEEINTTFKAIYHTNNTDYDVFITKETEKDNDEQENELEMIFRSLSNNDEKIYVVNKEEELEMNEKENSYSYTIYDNEQSFRKEEESYRVEYSIEQENNKEKIEIKVKDLQDEYEFKNIQQNNNVITFKADLESSNSETEIFVTLTYFDSYRVYSANNYNDIVKNN